MKQSQAGEYGESYLAGRSVMPALESIWADIKSALRQMRKSPGFSLTVIALLGLVATTAVFLLIEASNDAESTPAFHGFQAGFQSH